MRLATLRGGPAGLPMRLAATGRRRTTVNGANTTRTGGILLHAAPAGTAPMDFISYEDAADVLLRAVETREYDNLHIAAVAGAP